MKKTIYPEQEVFITGAEGKIVIPKELPDFVKPNLIETPEAGSKPEEENEYYRIKLWSGILEIYECKICGRQEDEEDDMIIHVLRHVPKDEREKVFNKLVKDKENGK